MDAPTQNSFKKFETWLWEGESAGKTKTTQLLWHTARICFAILRDIFSGNLTLHATALVYTTLLSIVPLIAFSFAILKNLGFQNRVEPILQNILEPLGSQRDTIIQKILDFVDRVNLAALGVLFIALLVYTVLSMVQKIEHSFNSIWRVSNMRSFVQRFSSYLSVILIGPTVIFIVLGAAADGLRRVISEEQFSWLYALFNQLTPFLMIIGLSTFLYIFMPNTKVKVRYALIGGLVTGVLWQITGRIFAFSAGNANYENIYPGLAIAVLFLFWIYLIWLILLVGCSVTFYSQHAKQITKTRNSPSSAVVDELTGLSILYRVASQFDQIGGGVAIVDIESKLSVGPETTQRIINKLVKHKILVVSGNGEELIPAQSLDKLYVTDVLKILRAAETNLPESLTQYGAVTTLMQEVNNTFDKVGAETTIAQWVRNHNN